MNLKLIYADLLSLQQQAQSNQLQGSCQILQKRYSLALAGYTELQTQLLLKKEYALVELLDQIICDICSLKTAH